MPNATNSTETAEIRSWVVGLGTAFGDDRGGWDVVARLRNASPVGTRITATSDPLAVVDAPGGCRLLVVVDACRGAGPPGSVHRFVWPDPRLVAAGTASSHGVGLAAALQLAGALGRLPPRVVVLAVEGTAGEPGAGLSRTVEAALPDVVALVLAELATESATTEFIMSDAVTLESLKSLAFLAPATDDELRRFISIARAEQHSAGAVLFREGDHLPHVFVVTAGTVALEVSGTDHRPRRFQTVGPGELLGWSPLLGPGPMTASARALTDAAVLAFDATAILALCEQDPQFGFRFMRRTAAAIAARLSATRLQLLDVYRHELPVPPPERGAS